MIALKPITNDKRENIIAAKERKESVETIKKWLNVSDSTISRIWNKYLQTGSYNPVPYTGRKSDITAEQDKQIRATILKTPDITIEKLIVELSINLTTSGMYRHLAKMELTLKKRRSILVDKSVKML